MNSTAKAIDSGLNGPTASRPKAAVIGRPSTSVPRIGKISRPDRRPSQSSKATATRDRMFSTMAPPKTVANSSSAITRSPVSRMRTPFSAVRPSRAASARTASTAAATGASAP